uniref:RNA-dependent RNA polymerase n=1 Tax=Lentinula edodes partitivirus 1 TaxID=1960320 RepID=A0A343WUI9_9VIRU|nr:RNA-dependent RNA polymerase [Lentinula edodes partitivirus 1]AWF73508.1 RNA-dependent RNA polymerase [Lentinula edodes partitivirus 1]
MVFQQIRDFLSERKLRIQEEWRRYQKAVSRDDTELRQSDASDIRRMYEATRDQLTEQEKAAVLDREFQGLIDSMLLKNENKKENFEFSSTSAFDGFPPNRVPISGIAGIPRRFHTGQIVSESNEVPESGYPLDTLIDTLITNKYPEYRYYVDKYTRPLGTTDATFKDFNKEQVLIEPLDPARKERVMMHVHERLATTPYLPIHFVDTQFCKLPLHTGTGYFQRHSFWTQTHSKYSRPEEYHDRPTSKGYVMNAFLILARTAVHKIKVSGLPFDFDFDDFEDDNAAFNELAKYLDKFLNDHATMLFTRNHISQRDGKLKQRPVYAVDDLFILIEAMLTFPLLVLARDPACCIMYGLETIRGSMIYIDQISRMFNSFATIDWSEYDQHVPRPITDVYYYEFLPDLIVINHGYQPTYEYPTYPDLDEHAMYKRIDNLLFFLHFWYNNMTFVTADGYGYRRKHCGVPSGLFNTQYLDSFGNTYLIIDGLCEFGCSDEEIRLFLIFVMGDDNSLMSYWTLERLIAFIQFFEAYAKMRYNMTLSRTKSTLTAVRSKIEMLGYQCNFGRPSRPIGKLVAQLCYPERGLFRKFMSYRAIGVAYASAGIDVKFYKFCKDIYFTYLPYAVAASEFNFLRAATHLPGYLKAFDDVSDYINFEKFPTIYEIREVYSYYHGPLSYEPKWNRAHFINRPNIVPPSAKTVGDYRRENNLQPRQVPVLPTD